MAAALLERRANAALDAISRECARDLGPAELMSRVAERLRSAVGWAADGWTLLDPQTLMFTGGVRQDCPSEVLSCLMENEFRQPDVVKFSGLARSPRPVDTIWQATGAQPERSARFRRILRPSGFGDELRAVFRSGGTSWGGVSLVRREGDEPFSPADAALVSAAGSHLAGALQRTLGSAATSCDPAGDTAAGVLILSRDDTPDSLTPEAARLLRQAAQADHDDLPLPMVVYSVAHRVRAAAVGRGTPRATARMLLSSGQWLSADAAPLDDADGSPGRVAVVLQPARPAHLAPVLLAAKGLTLREREVARMLLAGHASEHIARHLVISRHTLRDHVKTIYAKFGVTSRAEFTALLLHEETT